MWNNPEESSMTGNGKRAEQRRELLELDRGARRLVRQRKYKEAERKFRQALAIDPHDVYLLVGLGDAKRKEKQELAGVEALKTRVFKLKYVDAGDAAALLKDQVSERGVINVLEARGQRGWEFGANRGKLHRRGCLVDLFRSTRCRLPRPSLKSC